jgi:hypothetical protein
LEGTENGLGEIGNGELVEPNVVLPVGMGSGVDGDGGTFGLKPGEGHKVADGAEGVDNSPPPSGLADSSSGSTTVGSNEGGDCDFSFHP